MFVPVLVHLVDGSRRHLQSPSLTIFHQPDDVLGELSTERIISANPLKFSSMGTIITFNVLRGLFTSSNLEKPRTNH